MEDWAEIRRLHRAEGVPIKEIARRLGIARNGSGGVAGGVACGPSLRSEIDLMPFALAAPLGQRLRVRW